MPTRRASELELVFLLLQTSSWRQVFLPAAERWCSTSVERTFAKSNRSHFQSFCLYAEWSWSTERSSEPYTHTTKDTQRSTPRSIGLKLPGTPLGPRSSRTCLCQSPRPKRLRQNRSLWRGHFMHCSMFAAHHNREEWSSKDGGQGIEHSCSRDDWRGRLYSQSELCLIFGRSVGLLGREPADTAEDAPEGEEGQQEEDCWF